MENLLGPRNGSQLIAPQVKMTASWLHKVNDQSVPLLSIQVTHHQKGELAN